MNLEKEENPIILEEKQITVLEEKELPKEEDNSKENIEVKTEEDKIESITEIGAFEMNEVYATDCVVGMQKLPENSIDLVLTSPPYDNLRDYKGYEFEFEKIATEIYRVLKKGGILVWVVGDKTKNGNRSLTSFRQAIFFQGLGFNAHDVMIYQKKNTPFMRSNAYTNCFEYMFIFAKGKPNTFNPLKTKTVRQGKEKLVSNKKADGINNKVWAELKAEKTRTNIWKYAVGLGGSTKDKIAFQHTAIFPEKLASEHIVSWTNENDIVLDPMCGSGTTCKMAKFHKRNFIGFDISEEYVEIAKERLKMLDNQPTLDF